MIIEAYFGSDKLESIQIDDDFFDFEQKKQIIDIIKVKIRKKYTELIKLIPNKYSVSVKILSKKIEEE